MKIGEEIMDVHEAFDLTGWCRPAAELAGCHHHTVKKYVQQRDAGKLILERPQRPKATDLNLPRIRGPVANARYRAGEGLVYGTQVRR